MKKIIRAVTTVAILSSLSLGAMSVQANTNISSAAKWETVAVNVASGIQSAFGNAAIDKPVYVAPGKSVFERSMLASLSGALIQRGIRVTDNPLADAYRFDITATVIPQYTKPRYRPGEGSVVGTGVSATIGLAEAANKFWMPVGLGALFDAVSYMTRMDPEDPVQVVLNTSLVDSGGAIKAKASTAFLIERSMAGAFWPAAATQTKSIEVR